MAFGPSTISFRKHTIGAASVQQISQEINQQENTSSSASFDDRITEIIKSRRIHTVSTRGMMMVQQAWQFLLLVLATHILSESLLI